MARYRGPRRRIVRRLQTALSGLTKDLPDERRPYPPGQHGPRRRRLRLSDYAVRLREKQKLLYYYGLTEGQFSKYVKKAVRKTGNASENLVHFLELRLDNVVFRLGFAPTIPAARQLVNHGHVLVNQQVVTIPSFQLSIGHLVQVRAKSRTNLAISEAVKRGPELSLPNYLDRSDNGFTGKVVGKPTRSDVPIDFDEHLVIEYYTGTGA